MRQPVTHKLVNDVASGDLWKLDIDDDCTVMMKICETARNVNKTSPGGRRQTRRGVQPRGLWVE